MLKRLLSTIGVLILIHVTSFAQFQDKMPQIKPIAPNAAAQYKVLERPIGTYTGTIPVSFPLITLNSGSLSTSLSLNYNSTGGVRVEEAASSVGLGFSLSDGGGRIVQVVNDVPDDEWNGLLDNNALKPSNFSCFDMQDILLSSLPNDNANRTDLEPDLFLFDFNGVSGKFFFKEDGSIVVSGNDAIKIEYDYGISAQPSIRRWIITDQNGNKYYFGQNKARTGNNYLINDYSYHSINNNTFSNGPSSRCWYLTEVYDMNEENTIKYSYVSSSGNLTTFSGGYMQLTPGTDCNGFNVTPDESTVLTNMSELIVSRIDGNSGYVLVNSTTNRLDGAWGRKVNTIELYDSANVLKRKYAFNYGYFNSWSTDEAYLRLKLNSFSEFGSTGTDSLCHQFEYNESVNLPSRYSRSVDFWGFFNNAYNPWYFPNVKYQYGSTTYRKIHYSNRTANGGPAQANILTKIIYPTGGYRQFIYEGNTALLKSGDEIFYDPDYTVNQSFTRTDFTSNVSPLPCLKHTFTVNSTDGGAVFSYTLTGMINCIGYSVKVFKTTGEGDLTGGVEQLGFINGEREVVNGYYRLEVYKTSVGCSFSSVTGSWGECTLSTATIATPRGNFTRNNREVGGVRVKEIRDYDPVTNKINTTEYKYKLYSTDSTFTSGLLVSPVKLTWIQNPSSIWCTYLALYSTGSYPLSKQGSSFVVYPEVRTIENGNGWTDQQFSFAEDDVNFGAFPMIPAFDNTIRRGMPVSEKVYQQNGSLLKRSSWTYGFGSIGLQGGVRSKPYYYNSVNNPPEREQPIDPNELPHHADCETFNAVMEYRIPLSKKDTIFSASGNYVIQTDYSYSSYNNQMILKQVRAAIDNGSTKETTYKYPFTQNTDFTFGLTAAEQTMKTTLLNKNYLQPLEEVDSLKPSSGTGRLVSGSKYSFGTFNSSDIHLSQGRSYTNLIDYMEVKLSAYDIKGNLTEKYKTNDTKEVYLWGYNYNYPVAKVTGSTYSAVVALVNNNILQSLSTTDAAMRTELNKIRTGLAGSMALVTTYTYKPLVGMTSETDPSGKIIYYEYDSLGRLKLIKDKDGKILKQYDYQYQQPVTQ